MYKINDNNGQFIFLDGEIHEFSEFKEKDDTLLCFSMNFTSPIIYEVIRFIDRKGVFFKDHYDRFCNSLSISDIKNIITLDEIEKACYQVLKANKLKNNNLKWMYSLDEKTNKPICLIYASKSFYPDKKYYENGIATAVLGIERPTPNAKISRKDYIDRVTDYREKKGVFEVLLKNSKGQLTEGSRSNLFFIKDDVVYTAPKEFILEGIMRKHVFEVCNSKNIKIIDKEPITYDMISHMDAAFITGTSINVLPISTVENTFFYDTKNSCLIDIMNGFEERIAEEWKMK